MPSKRRHATSQRSPMAASEFADLKDTEAFHDYLCSVHADCMYIREGAGDTGVPWADMPDVIRSDFISLPEGHRGPFLPQTLKNWSEDTHISERDVRFARALSELDESVWIPPSSTSTSNIGPADIPHLSVIYTHIHQVEEVKKIGVHPSELMMRGPIDFMLRICCDDKLNSQEDQDAFNVAILMEQRRQRAALGLPKRVQYGLACGTAHIAVIACMLNSDNGCNLGPAQCWRSSPMLLLCPCCRKSSRSCCDELDLAIDRLTTVPRELWWRAEDEPPQWESPASPRAKKRKTLKKSLSGRAPPQKPQPFVVPAEDFFHVCNTLFSTKGVMSAADEARWLELSEAREKLESDIKPTESYIRGSDDTQSRIEAWTRQIQPVIQDPAK
ncbi:hypothetical protein DACRYDRAFT_113852 [Dacryopinax primogenitus]|uniref:Uncharacterized protein n=1 Tax=Dacryopinax primogenitus (strain DJM 731) TaxID=1858805 RepID=M5GAF3_DACPD|nr:uncharacterized protein DACRYDRAFT_113852 [Dacryopinax primogenitus]EJU05814.1 hypothetical protein DACRYDRAFT_113852 [Dacryopinax primogenitus]